MNDFYALPLYQNMVRRYAVTVTIETIAGVDTEVFTPMDGVAEANKQSVLINLHGGGFVSGSRTLSHVESMPIAAVAKRRVISIDYRQGPEHTFPAATDDIIAVYKALLLNYQSESIGLFGCSAGAALAAQTIARLQEEGLPLPGALVMSASAAGPWDVGDSWRHSQTKTGAPTVPTTLENVYFQGADVHSPSVFPGHSAELMATFPPTLLASSTRDFALSSVLLSHTQLVSLGVKADLHVWEGLDHAFLYDAELQASREFYDVVAQFFRRTLSTC